MMIMERAAVRATLCGRPFPIAEEAFQSASLNVGSMIGLETEFTEDDFHGVI